MPRIDHRFADAFLVGHRRHGADHGNEPGGGQLNILLHGEQIHIRIEGGERVDHGGKNVHRMGAARKMVEEMAHVLVKQGILVQETGEKPALLLIRERPVHQQISDLHERLRLDQFLDRNAAVAQNPLFPVDEGDPAVTDGGIGKTPVQRHISGLLPERADVESLFPFRSDHDGKTDLPAADF